MAQIKRSPFIQGFKEPTLTKNNFITLADIRGDGQGKLIIWSDQQSQLIVYKGSNRQLQKPSKIKNASGIITYFDQQRNPKAVVAISAENGLYIFRSMIQSFRLRIPDIFAKQQQQILWSQYESNPQNLAEQLKKIPKKSLSETARHFISATTAQRRLQLIQKVFSQGINQKDSISSMCYLKQGANLVGNVVLGTQLNRLYILDCYGHTILQERIIQSAPIILLAHGTFQTNFLIVSIDRQGQVSFHVKYNVQEAAQRIKFASRVITADLNYPQMIICTQDQVLSVFSMSNSFSKLYTKKYSFKLPKQPIKVIMIEYKNVKLSFVVFQDQFRIYQQKQLIYSFITPYKMYDLLFGSFAKQQNCIIMLYENHGFQVLILHRQFNPKQNYGSNKKSIQVNEDILIPKKTTEFKSYWTQEKDQSQIYKLYQRNIRILKWMTYKQKFSQKTQAQTQLKVNSKILGLGPDFIIKISIQNRSDEPLTNLRIIPIYSKNSIKITKMLRQLSMISPNTEYNLDMRIESLSLKNQVIDLQIFFGNSMSKTTIHIPNCEQFVMDQ